jgi:hypothetical protein
MEMDTVLVKAHVPRDLKRRAFSALALQEESFSAWLRMQLERLAEAPIVEQKCGEKLAGSETRG